MAKAFAQKLSTMSTFGRTALKTLVVFLGICAASFSAAFAQVQSASAATAPGYSGQLLSASPMGISMQPGETKRIEIEIKNNGGVTWSANSKAFPVLYTYFPKYRKSVFRASNWLENGSSPMRYKGADVAPGKTMMVAFDITAPKTQGFYEEGFWLAAFNKTWIPGTQFKLAITVGAPNAPRQPNGQEPSAPQQVTPNAPTTGTQDVTYIPPSVTNFSALVMSRVEKMQLKGGAQSSVRIAVKNTGNAVWPMYAVRQANLAHIASTTPPAQLMLMEAAKPVDAGSLVIVDIPFKAPDRRGEYTLAFVVNVAGQDVNGGYIELPVTVTDDANLPSPPVPTQPIQPSLPGQYPGTTYETLESEPILRVGLYKTESGEQISGDVAYRVSDANGVVFFDMPPNGAVSLSYANGMYRALSDSGLTAVSNAPLRLTGRDVPAVFTVVTRPNRPTWNLSLNDNRFRGVMEIRYSDKNATTWIINEVPIEQYLKGLIEAGEGSSYPTEYQKALVTAARSYAYYHYSTKSKHKDRGFDVDANYDQVYRGYGAEIRQPRTSFAVEATRGMVVRYMGGLAVTPYYTRSDGRTRSYQEVWFKAVPYLVSVPAQYDQGKALNGHGVGMSQWDAITRANAEGLNWLQLIKYYYTGVDVTQKW